MRLFAENDPPLKRGVVLLGGLAAVAALFAVALAMILPSRDVVEERRPRGPKLAAPPATEQARPHPGPAPRKAVAPPTKVETAATLSRSMDRSNVRHLVGLLKQAAASGDRSLESSMVAALTRSPGAARPVLEEELASTDSGPVRAALHEALSRCP